MRVADCALPDLDASVGLDLTAPDAAVQLNLWLQVLRVDILGPMPRRQRLRSRSPNGRVEEAGVTRAHLERRALRASNS